MLKFEFPGRDFNKVKILSVPLDKNCPLALSCSGVLFINTASVQPCDLLLYDI